MYFILETIIFIARLFPDRQPEAIRQERREQEKKPSDTSANLLSSAKSTSKPGRAQKTAKVTIGSHASSESAHISTHSNASLEEDVVDGSTLINVHGSGPLAERSVHLTQSTRPLRPCNPPSPCHATRELQQNSTPTHDTHHQTDRRRHGAVGSMSSTNVEQAIVDMLVQAGSTYVSTTHPRKTLALRNAESRTQDVASNTYIYNTTSGISISESTLVNTPTEALPPLELQRESGEEAHASGEQKRGENSEARSRWPLLGRGNDGPFEAVGKVPQGTGEQVAAERTESALATPSSNHSYPEASSSFGVTENGDSEPLEAENDTGSQILGASDANVDATAAVIDPSLKAQYDLLMQSINTVAELREARDGKMRMTESEPEDAPSEDIPRATRATWAPFPWVEVEVEIEKSPLDLMNELPLDWMLPTPPTIRLSDVQGRIGESSRRRYSSAVQDGMHIANMKAWIDSIAPLEKGINAAKTLKTQPPRVTPKAQDSKSANEGPLDAKPLSENQTEEAESTADGQRQEMMPSSGTQTTQAPRMDLPPFEEELSSLIDGIRNLSLGPSIEPSFEEELFGLIIGIQKLSLGPSIEPSFEEGLSSLINGIENLSLGPSIDTASEKENEIKAREARNSNVSGQNLENLINGIRNLSLGPSVDAAGRYTKESRVQLSGDWNVSGRGQYSPKDLDKGPIFGRFLDSKSEVRDPGFTPKEERIAAPKVEITKEIDHKCKKAQSVVMPSKKRITHQADAERQEQHQTTSPVPISEEQSNTNTLRSIPHPEQSQKQDLTTNHPAATTSTTETHPQNAIPHPPLEPRPPTQRNDQPPPPSEEGYVSVYSLQGLAYPDAVPKTRYRDPFSLRRDRR